MSLGPFGRYENTGESGNSATSATSPGGAQTTPQDGAGSEATPLPLAKPSRSMSAVIWALVVGLLVLGAMAAVLGYRYRNQRRQTVQGQTISMTGAGQTFEWRRRQYAKGILNYGAIEPF